MGSNNNNNNNNNNNMIVLYPSPAMGHLISMVELAKLILTHHPSLSITILMTTPPYNTGSTSPYINHVSKTIPLIHFHHLPIISLPLNSTSSPHHEALAMELLHLNNPHVHHALLSLSQASTIRAFIIDFFCCVSFDVARELGIHTYLYCTSGAACLGLFLYFPTLHNTTTKSFRELDNGTLDVPELPPIPGKDMPKPMLDRFDKAYEGFLYMAMKMPKSKGIIINTFESLEYRAITAIRDGLYVNPSPPIHCIGPLIASADHNEGREEEKRCRSWLDSQPTRSVVFLCFGSLGLFSMEQLREIAIGLERSEQRFLWVVRSPPVDDQMERLLVAPPEPTLQTLLPEGFLDRTKDRGLVVKSWAPQVKVLSHVSVGGFVTHCGWNSILEALRAGVPMVAWPLYAEQRFNRVVMVEEMKLCLSMEELEGSDGLVSAEEIDRKVRQVLIDSQLRERTMEARESAKAALSDEGSSLKALDELAKSWMSSE
ncbi:hypothetical protein Sjap_004780 [Stephania japonica]|uniref:Glycosyltransferase n=1 Tax=Stephania japonica TaxID=461633 RepID=A0AAP0PI45_9MAGN